MAKRERPLCRKCQKRQTAVKDLCKACAKEEGTVPVPVPPKPVVETIKLDDIDLAASWQPREEINKAVVASYAEIMEANESYDPFPPLVVFRSPTDGKLRLGDGFQRAEAAYDAGLTEVPVEIREGEYEDAKLYAASANANHGLRMTTADKRRAVAAVLEHAEGRKWNDRAIGRWCGVDHVTVGKVRSSLVKITSEEPSGERTYVTKHGTVATMDTGNIGRSSRSSSSPLHIDDPILPPDEPYTVDRSEADPEPPEDFVDPDFSPDDVDAPDDDPPSPDVVAVPRAAANGEAKKPELPATPEPLLDRVGIPVPEAKRAVFAGLNDCREIRRIAAGMAKVIDRFAHSPGSSRFRGSLRREQKGKQEDGPGEGEANIRYSSENLKTLLRELRFSEPYCCVCPWCLEAGGVNPDCRVCKGEDWVSENSWLQTRKEHRDMLEPLVVKKPQEVES
jgi:hypothetical protein